MFSQTPLIKHTLRIFQQFSNKDRSMQREKNNQVTDQMICHSNVRLVAQTADHGVPQCLSFSVLANMKKKKCLECHFHRTRQKIFKCANQVSTVQFVHFSDTRSNSTACQLSPKLRMHASAPGPTRNVIHWL